MVSCVRSKKRDLALRDKSLIASPHFLDRRSSLISLRGSQSKRYRSALADVSLGVLESHSGFDKTAKIDKQLTSKNSLTLKSTNSPTSNSATPRILEEESQALFSAKQSYSTQAKSINQSRALPKARSLESVLGDWGVKGGIRSRACQAAPLSPLEKNSSKVSLESSVDCHAVQAPLTMTEKHAKSSKMDSRKNAQSVKTPAKDSRICDEKTRQSCNSFNNAQSTSPKPMPYTIAVIGLGYVGLPLALTFGTKYPTIGFDINPTRVKELQEKLDSSGECGLQDFLQAPLVRFSSNPNDIAQATIYLIAVPTPIAKDKLPDLSCLQSACELVGSMLQVGDIVVFESTTYPTCTRTFCAPLLESISKLQLNRDFFVGYSPERINPADKIHRLSQVVKITSGSNKESAATIDKLYASVIPAGTHCVSSIEIAEASKALENAQRDINIAFMNEAYMLFDTLELDMAEILQAARTKWNFLPFYPGLVGGHCISVDPYYLSYIAELKGFSPKLLTKARIVNEAMPHFIARKFAKQLESAGISLQGARVLVVGFAFKKDCRDMRNTKVPHLCYELESLGLQVEVLDSLIDRDRAKLEYGICVLESKQLIAASGDNSYDGVLCNVLHTCDARIDLTSLCKPRYALMFVSP